MSGAVSSDKREGSQSGPLAALVLHINSQNTIKQSSPIDSIARALLPVLKSTRMFFAALVNRTDVIKNLTEFSRLTGPYGLVSIDFFDTLVTRQVEPPGYVLGKLAEISVSEINRLFGLALTEEDYLRARTTCEQALRREKNLVDGLDAEIGLPAVLERMLQQLGIGDEELLGFLVNAEVCLETEVLSLTPGASELLHALKSENKQTAVLSDMYLPAALLGRVAQKLGILAYIDSIYVSGDVGLSKRGGRLFEYLIREKGVTASDVIHIGDNFDSDYKAAAKAGITAKWLHQPERLKNRRGTEQRLRSNPENYVRELIRGKSDQLYRPSDVLQRELFTRLAPVIFTMAYKSLRACTSLGIERLYFLAREGIGIRPVFEQLINYHPEFSTHTFQLKNLYCSRASTVCCRAPEPHDARGLMTMVAERSDDYSFEGLLKAWNINAQQLPLEPQDVTATTNREQLLEFLDANPELTDAVNAYIQNDREKLRAYLVQESVPGAPCALIDVGWSGTIQRNIDALGINAQMFGMYVGTNEKFEARNFRGHIFSPSDYRTGAVHKSAGLAETLLSISSVGTTVGYEFNDGTVRPVFQDSGEITGSIEAIRSQVFEDFYPVFEELTRKHCIPTPVLAEHARREYFALVCHPGRLFLQALDQLKFNFDWGRAEAHPLVGRISLADLFRPRKTFLSLWRSPWLFGTLKASNLSFLNSPISWVLGHEERINRNTLRRFKRLLDTAKQ